MTHFIVTSYQPHVVHGIGLTPAFVFMSRFPDGFEYRWADGVGIKTPIKCTSTDYIDYVMTFVVTSSPIRPSICVLVSTTLSV